MAEYWKKEDVLKAISDLRIDTIDPKVDYAFCRFQEVTNKYLASVIPVADVVEKRSCNTCQWYEGVHNTPGLAPCSFWNIGGVMWNDFCLRWKGENDG